MPYSITENTILVSPATKKLSRHDDGFALLEMKLSRDVVAEQLGLDSRTNMVYLDRGHRLIISVIIAVSLDIPEVTVSILVRYYRHCEAFDWRRNIDLHINISCLEIPRSSVSGKRFVMIVCGRRRSCATGENPCAYTRLARAKGKPPNFSYFRYDSSFKP